MYNTALFNQIIFNGLPDLEIESPTQELAISQQTPIQNYDYSLTVASQTLLIDQPISIIVAISKTLYPDAIGLTLSQSIPTINYDYSLGVSTLAITLAGYSPIASISQLLYPSALALTLSQKDPTLTYDYSLSVNSVGLLLSQPIPFYHWWTKEPVHSSIWIKELEHKN